MVVVVVVVDGVVGDDEEEPQAVASAATMHAAADRMIRVVTGSLLVRNGRAETAVPLCRRARGVSHAGHRDHCFQMRRTGRPVSPQTPPVGCFRLDPCRPPTATLTTHSDLARPRITREVGAHLEEAAANRRQPGAARARPSHRTGSATTRCRESRRATRARHDGWRTRPAHRRNRPVGWNSRPSRSEKSLLIYKECANRPKRTGHAKKKCRRRPIPSHRPARSSSAAAAETRRPGSGSLIA